MDSQLSSRTPVMEHAHPPVIPPAMEAHTAHVHASTFDWRPTVDPSDCRFQGLWTHALLLGALVMGAIPHATARGSPLAFSAAAVAVFACAGISRIMQSACLLRGGETELPPFNLHAVCGWLFSAAALAAAAVSAVLPRSECRVAAVRLAAEAEGAARRLARILIGVEVGLLGWATVLCCASGFFLLLTGLWSTLNCYSSPKFIGYEIGHLIPASLWTAAALVALQHIRPGADQAPRLLALQRAEGRMMLAGGAFFLTEITLAHHGAVLNHGGTHHDQQHVFSGTLWVCCGALALVLARFDVVTGMHMLVAVRARCARCCPCVLTTCAPQSAGHCIMILHHAQFSDLSRLTHQSHAGFLLLGSFFRCVPRIFEYSLLALLASLTFVFSSECPVRFAEDVDVNPAGYMLVVLALGTMLWTWTLQLAWGGGPADAPSRPADKHAHV